MSNLVKGTASKALDVTMFAVGLVTGTVRGVAARVRRHPEPDLESARHEVPQRHEVAQPSGAPQPREVPRPEPPQQRGPDPDDIGVTTPVGTTGAAPAYNPSTAEADLQQPGTEPLMDPSLTKKVKAETDMMRKAAERNPEDA